MANFDKGTVEYEMMGEYFKLAKKFWNVADSQQYWQTLIAETDAFIVKYERDTKGFSRRLGYELLHQCESMYKGVQECGC